MRMSLLKGAALVAASVAVAGLAVAGPADAAGKHPLSTAGLSAHATGLRANAVHPDTGTTYGAGYFSYPGEEYGAASASATFTMPNFSCKKSNDSEWLLPGIWTYDSSGDLSQQVDVNFNCNSGAELTQDVIVAGGAVDDGTLSINPGDTVETSLYYTSTQTVGVVRDITQGTSVTTAGDPVTGDYTVFVGDEGPSLFGVSKVPTFNKVNFSNVQINGQYLRDWSPSKFALNTSGTTQIKTSLLSGDQAFTTTFAKN